jgi:hypothetical protein
MVEIREPALTGICAVVAGLRGNFCEDRGV